MRKISSKYSVIIWLSLAALLLAACGAGYQQESGQWVFVQMGAIGDDPTVHQIEGVDQATFEKINSEYGKDAFRVYHRYQPIAGADPATFKHVRGLFWKDKDSVFYVDQPLPGADPASFRVLKYGYWARDDHNVYVGDNPVNPKDLGSFKQINQYWAKDASWYYAQDGGNYLPLETLDLATFEILEGGWAKDCCRVYYVNRIAEGADPATFELINQFRGKDSKMVYLMGWPQRTVEEEKELQERLKDR
jgi:hypothetical protein